MSAKSALNKAVFLPNDERMLAAVQVRRRTKKKIPFLATGGQGDYTTFICLSVTNKKPAQVFLTKVKQFEGSSSFVRRSQWTIGQLRQVNGIDSTRDCPEFDLMFENGSDQWIAGSAGEKCVFVQILHHTCQRYIPERKPDFINCHSKLLGAPALPQHLIHSDANSNDGVSVIVSISSFGSACKVDLLWQQKTASSQHEPNSSSLRYNYSV
ncbi:syntaxin-binding protein 6 isoform X2 [Chanodichthys erythropterus]|uniref:syntaxin-binding protein 6 isoform X2 n=1 Tax=Chanodichthys erythropterus TaxID=933992 RepID=UPI00351E0E91